MLATLSRWRPRVQIPSGPPFLTRIPADPGFFLAFTATAVLTAPAGTGTPATGGCAGPWEGPRRGGLWRREDARWRCPRKVPNTRQGRCCAPICRPLRSFGGIRPSTVRSATGCSGWPGRTARRAVGAPPPRSHSQPAVGARRLPERKFGVPWVRTVRLGRPGERRPGAGCSVGSVTGHRKWGGQRPVTVPRHRRVAGREGGAGGGRSDYWRASAGPRAARGPTGRPTRARCPGAPTSARGARNAVRRNGGERCGTGGTPTGGGARGIPGMAPPTPLPLPHGSTQLQAVHHVRGVTSFLGRHERRHTLLRHGQFNMCNCTSPTSPPTGGPPPSAAARRGPQRAWRTRGFGARLGGVRTHRTAASQPAEPPARSTPSPSRRPGTVRSGRPDSKIALDPAESSAIDDSARLGTVLTLPAVVGVRRGGGPEMPVPAVSQASLRCCGMPASSARTSASR